MLGKRLRIWIEATRPKTLSASIAPVAIGSAIAYDADGFHAGACAAAAFAAIGVQVACNFANDYFDARKGADTGARLGPVRAVSSGLISPGAMLTATMIVLAFVVAPCTAYLASRAGWPFLALGAVASALALLYTGSKWALAYLGLGDLFALVFFGPVAVAATFAAQTTYWSITPAVAGLGPGLIACAILTVNNLRDAEADRLANKRTLAVRFGPAFARVEFAACGIGAGVVAAAMAVWYGHWPLLFSLAAVVMLVPSIRRVSAGEVGASLNEVLAATGRALLAYGILFSIGWIG